MTLLGLVQSVQMPPCPAQLSAGDFLSGDLPLAGQLADLLLQAKWGHLGWALGFVSAELVALTCRLV